MLQDLRFGLKLLWKEKAFTITALLTLGLCIGANTAIFSVLHAVVLEPLPFSEPGQLISIGNIYRGAGMTKPGENAIPDYLDRRQMTDVFESVAMFASAGYDAGREGSPVRLDGVRVTPSYFHVLRASPLLGRVFMEGDAVYQKNQFVILSYALWQEMFGRDRNVIGRDLRLDGVPHRIVGVMPLAFADLQADAKFWVPLTWRPEQGTDEGRHNNSWDMIARLKTGVPLARAQSRVDAWNQYQLERSGKLRQLLENAKFGTVLQGLRERMTEDVRPTLYLLQGAVAFVLLIGCVNVANLILVRSNVRMKELAIRHSLGAGRGRLVVQLLVESLALAALGGGLGVVAGIGGVRLLALLGASELPRAAGIQVNGMVLAFSAAIAVLTGLAFGSVPIWHLMRRDLTGVFRSTERGGTTGKAALWTRSALVVCQVALAFVLLIGSGLLTLSFAKLLAVKPGFDAENVQTASFSLPRARYRDDTQARNFTTGLLEGLRRIPGVSAAGVSDALPFSNNANNSVTMAEGYVSPAGELPPVARWNTIDEGYLATMRIPLLQGRYFNSLDTPEKHSVIIDEFLARKYWPKGNAVGGRLRRGVDETDPWMTVVGVVAIIKNADLADKTDRGEVYQFYRQVATHSIHVVVRSASANTTAMASVRETLQRADRELALFDIKPMRERVANSVRERQSVMTLCLIFAGLAMLLSAIGIYGVLAYTVTHRTREFGIRMALGATGREVVGLVMRYGVRLAVIGLAIGIAAAFALTRLMASMLFDVQPGDPLVFATVAGGLLIVAMAASLAPALRVTGIRPADALRQE